MLNCFLSGSTPTMFCTASCPNLKTSVITFVNAHTIWHYLQMALLLSIKTLSTECYSAISINCVFYVLLLFCIHCLLLFEWLLYYWFYVIFYTSFHVACASVVCIKVPTYLLTYLLTNISRHCIFGNKYLAVHPVLERRLDPCHLDFLVIQVSQEYQGFPLCPGYPSDLKFSTEYHIHRKWKTSNDKNTSIVDCSTNYRLINS